ncbi:hypothetical protein [Streptomyces sp. NPDC096324]|uniref:hypothetical protein n=1 Tax=Streptomyces sp. NPDC096324 TaxID=3366085 RepID=UPI00382E33D4
MSWSGASRNAPGISPGRGREEKRAADLAAAQEREQKWAADLAAAQARISERAQQLATERQERRVGQANIETLRGELVDARSLLTGSHRVAG